jgi:hypothetical protein
MLVCMRSCGFAVHSSLRAVAVSPSAQVVRAYLLVCSLRALGDSSRRIDYFSVQTLVGQIRRRGRGGALCNVKLEGERFERVYFGKMTYVRTLQSVDNLSVPDIGAFFMDARRCRRKGIARRESKARARLIVSVAKWPQLALVGHGEYRSTPWRKLNVLYQRRS